MLLRKIKLIAFRFERRRIKSSIKKLGHKVAFNEITILEYDNILELYKIRLGKINKKIGKILS